MHVKSGVLLITSVLALCHFIGKEHYEFLAVTKVAQVPLAQDGSRLKITYPYAFDCLGNLLEVVR